MSYDLYDESSAALELYENWDDFKRVLRQGGDPIEIKNNELEQERLYKEYKEQCKWGRKPKTLGKLDPYWFSDELKNSIPKEEFIKLVVAFQSPSLSIVSIVFSRLGITVMILISIALYGLYVAVRDHA